ncbi:multidrug efflux pump subunit AcrB [Bradyrhizobium sp. AZCC 2230]
MNPADSPILVIAAYSDTLPITTVDDFADTVTAQQISQIKGVAQVVIGGEQKPAVRVQVDRAKLQTRGLALEDVQPRTLPRAVFHCKSGVMNPNETTIPRPDWRCRCFYSITSEGLTETRIRLQFEGLIEGF